MYSAVNNIGCGTQQNKYYYKNDSSVITTGCSFSMGGCTLNRGDYSRKGYTMDRSTFFI